MINTSEFAKRLQKVIDFYGESASAFAEKIGVQRSSISHILSGRNKPSLDFVMKVLSAYPEVELYWLLNGKGSFPSKPKAEQPKTESQKQSQLSFSDTESKPIPTPSKTNTSGKTIERIVIFYTDGSFQSFEG